MLHVCQFMLCMDCESEIKIYYYYYYYYLWGKKEKVPPSTVCLNSTRPKTTTSAPPTVKTRSNKVSSSHISSVNFRPFLNADVLNRCLQRGVCLFVIQGGYASGHVEVRFVHHVTPVFC